MKTKSSTSPTSSNNGGNNFQWLRQTLGSVAQALQAPPPVAVAAPPPPPSIIGTPLSTLVRDPRTCETALLDWALGVPDAISAGLSLFFSSTTL